MRFSQVLAARLVGNQEPRRAGRVHAGLRRAERPARRRQYRLGEDNRADLHCPSPAQFFKYASKKDWAQVAKDLRPVYTAASEAEALGRLADFSGKWEKRYPAIIRLWENAWAEFVPFLQFDREIRTVICTTNAIESINARLRRAVNARGHFPTEQAALKCLYLAIMSLDPTGKGRQRWTNRWKAALNAFDITFDGRLTAGRN
jgi:putative transposase